MKEKAMGKRNSLVIPALKLQQRMGLGIDGFAQFIQTPSDSVLSRLMVVHSACKRGRTDLHRVGIEAFAQHFQLLHDLLESAHFGVCRAVSRSVHTERERFARVFFAVSKVNATQSDTLSQ
jgi:hypothetical protein